MLEELKLRKTEIYKDYKWEPVEFKNLKKGDTFRLFDEDDSNPIETGEVNEATSDAYVNELGIYEINCKDR